MSTVPPITCEISEPGHGERGYCVPLMRNALASLLKEKASFGKEFGGISRSVGQFFSGVGMGSWRLASDGTKARHILTKTSESLWFWLIRNSNNYQQEGEKLLIDC